MSKFMRQLLPFGSLTLIICILSALKPDTFLTSDNFMNVLRRSSVNGIIAVGMTSIIISAGIDLSVGSISKSRLSASSAVLLTMALWSTINGKGPAGSLPG
ncbi:unnamed protein product, partial [marine sediment metagenome]